MTDAWEPANQLEQRLRDALRDADQDTYFSLVSGAELFVPLPPAEGDSGAASQDAFTWPTNTRDGRTHVLAYTSAEAARVCLGPAYQNFARMTLSDMARSWPDQEWWLAVNSGLPIEGYLPAWFIGQLTAGLQPPMEDPPAPDTAPPAAVQDDRPSHPGHETVVADAPAQGFRPPMPDGIPSLPARDGFRDVAAPDSPPPSPVLDRTSRAPAPEAAPPLPRDGVPRRDSPHQDSPQQDSLASVPAPEAMPPLPIRDGTPPGPPPEAEPRPSAPEVTPRSDTPAQDTDPAGPDASPVTLHLAPGAEFAPLDDEERALYEAATGGDRAAFLRTLLAVRQIWVPMIEGGDLMLGPGRPGFRWYTERSGGRTTLPLFTGPGRMREAMGGHPFVLSDLAKVLRFWPDPAYDLVINAGTPIGASIPGDRITAMSHQVDAEAAARLANDFPAQSDAERQLFEARNTPEMQVKILLETTVFLPVWSRMPPTVQTPPSDPAFPWSAVPVRGRASVLAFTSFDWMKAAVGTTGFVMPAFADLLAAWPEPEWAVSVNPGTPIEVSLSGEQLRALVSPTGVRPDAEAPPAAAPQLPADAARAEAPQTRTEAPPGPPPGLAGIPSAVEAQEDGAEGAEADAHEQPESPETPLGAWTIMQKVVPHSQVSWYLEQAYDRVGGFVHRVEDVVELGTPARLYESLGLLREGSPFQLDDAEVLIIRWPAYRSGLYRTPFGGSDEESRARWGNSGWVIERSPFAGDGFAPGSGGSVREYKIDSMRLPHGSEMYAIGSDGSERFVARYDADRLVWEDKN